MKRIICCLALVLLSSSAFAGDRYEINKDPYGSSYGSSYGGSTEIEMKKKYNYDPSTKFKGEIDNDGSVRMKNSNGDRLRGTIDRDGYGKLRDQDGNIYKVKPY